MVALDRIGSDRVGSGRIEFGSVRCGRTGGWVGEWVRLRSHRLQVVQFPVLVDLDERRSVREHFGIDRLAIKSLMLHLRVSPTNMGKNTRSTRVEKAIPMKLRGYATKH